MRGEELMLGDWVYLYPEKDEVGKIYGIEKSFVWFIPRTPAAWTPNKDGAWWNWVKDMRPIPLTEEIIKKNFEKKTHYGIFDDFFDFEIREFNDGLYIVNYHNCEFSMPDSQILGISYVHELQHAMRIMGVNKEIEL